jgi:ABC-type sugar transport system substrate-binding protein
MGGQSPEGPFSPKGLVPQVPTDQLPPEMLTGIMQAAQTISATLDSFAQATPDKGAQLALIKDLLQRYLADLTVAGAGPVSPTAPGPAAPMGGIDRGISGPGSI